jgi:hypothetical protein
MTDIKEIYLGNALDFCPCNSGGTNGGGVPPTPDWDGLLTEGGDNILTEDGEIIIIE